MPDNIALTRFPSTAVSKGLVTTRMPGLRWLWPRAVFSAYPVTNGTLRPGRSSRGASASLAAVHPVSQADVRDHHVDPGARAEHLEAR